METKGSDPEDGFNEQAWYEQEARPTPDAPIDPELMGLIVDRENAHDKLAESGGRSSEAEEELRQANRSILKRKRELGIDPLTHPEVDPPAPQE